MLAVASLCALFLTACDDDGDGSGAAPAAATVTATADTVNVAPGATSNLVANDTYDAAAATTGASGNVSFALSAGATLPTGITIAADGTLSVAADAPPGAASFDYQLCDTADTTNCSTATVSLTVQRNVAGVMVAPAQLATATSAALRRAAALRSAPTDRRTAQAVRAATTATCPNVPVGYDPLANVTVTPLRADGTPAGTPFTTDSCGGFSVSLAPDVSTLSIAATATLQARTFDVTTFTASTSVGSTLPVGASYEIASLYLLPSQEIGMSVIDSLTKKAVIGLPASEVTAKVDATPRALAGLESTLNSAPSSTTLVMDASGSMQTVVYTDATSGLQYDRYALASIAAGEFLNGKQTTDEVSIVVFDSSVTAVDDAFLAGLSFVDATSGAAKAVSVGADGYTADLTALLAVANFYNRNSAIYERCYNAGGVLLPTCFAYLSNSDTSVRLTSSYPFGGSTALWAASDQALDNVVARSSTRKFVVAMTDGEDNASGGISSADVIAKATQHGVPVYMVAFGTQASVNETEMQQVASATGGSYYRQESQGIIGIFQAIQTGIRFQYTLNLATPALTSGQVVTVDIGGSTRDITIP
jgi:Mg-chelatase subunit ChlD